MANLWLPQVYGNDEVDAGPCRMVRAASQFVTAWMEVLGDRAAIMRCDDRLIWAAQRHAEFLAARTPEEELLSGHIGLGGTMPNDRVRAAGYNLVDWFEPGKNNVESWSRTDKGPSRSLQRLLLSPSHHDHLMVIGGFASHTVYGVGNAANDYVILICPPEP